MMELLQQRAEGRTSKHQFVRMLFQDSCQCVGGNENGRRSWGGGKKCQGVCKLEGLGGWCPFHGGVTEVMQAGWAASKILGSQ